MFSGWDEIYKNILLAINLRCRDTNEKVDLYEDGKLR